MPPCYSVAYIIVCVVILVLWFDIVAPVAGALSPDQLVSFTAPEINSPVSILHIRWRHFCCLAVFPTILSCSNFYLYVERKALHYDINLILGCSILCTLIIGLCCMDFAVFW